MWNLTLKQSKSSTTANIKRRQWGGKKRDPENEVKISASPLMTCLALFPNERLRDEPKEGKIFAWSDFSELPWWLTLREKPSERFNYLRIKTTRRWRSLQPKVSTFIRMSLNRNTFYKQPTQTTHIKSNSSRRESTDRDGSDLLVRSSWHHSNYTNLPQVAPGHFQWPLRNKDFQRHALRASPRQCKEFPSQTWQLSIHRKVQTQQHTQLKTNNSELEETVSRWQPKQDQWFEQMQLCLFVDYFQAFRTLFGQLFAWRPGNQWVKHFWSWVYQCRLLCLSVET